MIKKWIVSLTGLTFALAIAGVVTAFALTGDGNSSSEVDPGGVQEPAIQAGQVSPVSSGKGLDYHQGIYSGESYPVAHEGKEAAVPPNESYLIPGGSGVPNPPPNTFDDRGPATPTKEVRAPIDGVEVIIGESLPIEYAVRVASGLPNGCAQFGQLVWERDGTTSRIDVLNREPVSSGVVCTQVYGTTENTIELGTARSLGRTYTVEVNGVTETDLAR